MGRLLVHMWEVSGHAFVRFGGYLGEVGGDVWGTVYAEIAYPHPTDSKPPPGACGTGGVTLRGGVLSLLTFFMLFTFAWISI